MVLPSLAVFSFLVALVAAQEISYDSMLCHNFGFRNSTAEYKKVEYLKMVDSLNNATTLDGQEEVAADFVNNYWGKWLKGKGKLASTGSTTKSPGTVSMPIVFTNQWIIHFVNGQVLFRLEARWRLVSYLNDILSMLESKLESEKFDEIRNSLWAMDKEYRQDVRAYYPKWIDSAINAVPTASKRRAFKKELEKKHFYVYYEKDMDQWEVSGSSQCIDN